MGVNRRFSRRKIKKPIINDNETCALCELSSNEPYLGQLFCQSGISVHENCLFFSPVLTQVLDPSVNKKGYLLGFQIAEIEKEVKRISKLKCTICKDNKAGIGCCNTSCRKSFHLLCGLKNNALGIFTDSFQFYCNEHASRQNLDNELASCNEVVPECAICLDIALDEEIDVNITIKSNDNNYDKNKSNWLRFMDKLYNREIIHGLCCTRSWMHKMCMSRYGLSAGLHHVKCPYCSNKTSFVDTVQHCGIWLPDRDASWELVPGAYQEMYVDNDVEGINESIDRTTIINEEDMTDRTSIINEELSQVKDRTSIINEEGSQGSRRNLKKDLMNEKIKEDVNILNAVKNNNCPSSSNKKKGILLPLSIDKNDENRNPNHKISPTPSIKSHSNNKISSQCDIRHFFPSTNNNNSNSISSLPRIKILPISTTTTRKKKKRSRSNINESLAARPIIRQKRRRKSNSTNIHDEHFLPLIRRRCRQCKQLLLCYNYHNHDDNSNISGANNTISNTDDNNLQDTHTVNDDYICEGCF